MSTDRFGNAYAPGLPYARGHILTSTEDDFRKLQEAWRHMAARLQVHGPEALCNFSGLEHGLPLHGDELPMASDFLAPALYFDRFKQAALAHFGGSPERHDVALFNRLTGATYATHLTLVKPGDVVIGVSASYSHPSVVRAVAHAGATLIDTTGLAQDHHTHHAVVDQARFLIEEQDRTYLAEAIGKARFCPCKRPRASTGSRSGHEPGKRC
jgi:L-seryl-tRNA(Ser) seleniumtransferase